MKIEYALLIVLLGLGLSAALGQLGASTRALTEHATSQTTSIIDARFNAPEDNPNQGDT